MAQARGKSLFFRKGGRAGAWLAVGLTLLVAPALAQDAGVSGIAPGPGNINGLNGSVRDPSGIGNAARVPSLPPPNITPMMPPGAVPLTSTAPALVRLPRGRVVRWSHLSPRERRIAERARIRENDRLLRHGVTSICRGC
ncbi:MAG TPA: hypothetical protein VKR55_30710 [Bradyrhizobium sp.]|uniref:hypothetical protein n=1 Tax=Bradyrhizobium sp. TaxID=376 RepID=UPI002C4110C9|nr:hypothetical protein [Bradyrhizobium sp.]HLZ06505.1 hypothetical protein [Bradyrhizobium sp.]